MSKLIERVEDFTKFIAQVEDLPDYVHPRAFGIGIATLSDSGNILDTWYPFPNWEANYGTASVLASVLNYRNGHATHTVSLKQTEEMLRHFVWCENDGKVHGNVDALKNICDLLRKEESSDANCSHSKKVGIVCFIPPDDQDTGACNGIADAYLRLHLLSHRLVKPNHIKIGGIFATLPNNYWTNEGPVAEEDITNRRFKSATGLHPLLVHSRDKFPRMLDYVTPSEVRIADANRVRLGACLGKGVTVMHEGFCNFNAGAEGPNMIEGRVSAGVFVDARTDIGGGASIMGTLSGGGKEVIALGKDCLIGANSGVGISLGDFSTVEAGLYITAGTKILLEDDSVVKAETLSGQKEMLFIRDSQSGTIKMFRRKNKAKLNEMLHKMLNQHALEADNVMIYNIIKAQEKHFDEIIPLLFETGYYEYTALNNNLNLSAAEFHKLQTLKPYLKYMYVLMTDEKVIGFYIAATKKQIKEIKKNTTNVYRDDPDLMSCIDSIASYYCNDTLETDLIGLNCAIHPKYRGQGLYRMIKNNHDDLAKKQHCTRIIFGVWRSNPAGKIFKDDGAIYTGEIDCHFQSFHDQLMKGFFTV